MPGTWPVAARVAPLRIPPVQELQKGLWWWEARHPEWTAEDDEAGHGWGPEVSSYAIDDGERLLLFDPTTPPAAILDLAAKREPVIVLTNPWHERDARSLVEKLGASVYVPPPEDFNDDVAWLRGDLEQLESEGRVIRAGDRLPIGVHVLAGKKVCDLVLWVESRRALVVGDTLLDRGRGFELPVDAERRGSRRSRCSPGSSLLELPVELVLPTRGAPTDRAALERALSPIVYIAVLLPRRNLMWQEVERFLCPRVERVEGFSGMGSGRWPRTS